MKGIRRHVVGEGLIEREIISTKKIRIIFSSVCNEYVVWSRKETQKSGKRIILLKIRKLEKKKLFLDVSKR